MSPTKPFFITKGLMLDNLAIFSIKMVFSSQTQLTDWVDFYFSVVCMILLPQYNNPVRFEKFGPRFESFQPLEEGHHLLFRCALLLSLKKSSMSCLLSIFALSIFAYSCSSACKFTHLFTTIVNMTYSTTTRQVGGQILIDTGSSVDVPYLIIIPRRKVHS